MQNEGEKTMKRTIALLLCLVLLCGTFSVCVAAKGTIASCGGKCEYYPTIIVPGLGQSSVVMVDENGDFIRDKDGKKASAFPAYLQTGKLIKTLAKPLLLSLFLQKDAGLSDAFAAAIGDAFGVNACDLNAQPVGSVVTEKYPYPYSQYNDEEREVTNSHVPFEMYPTDLPRDHLYYFAYNSFGNHIGLAEELFDFIKMVQAQTGHKKVNLVPLSQGASIVSAMLDYHPEIGDMLHKIMFVVPALDGSKIIGDVFTDRVTFLDSDYLYHGFLENIRLLDQTTASFLELVLRILPDEVWMAALKKGVKTLVEDVMTTSTGMWALCPSGDYEAAAAQYLSAPERANIKAQTDRYYGVQKRSRANIAALVKKGVQVFCVAEYDYALINVGERWNDQNADFIIQLDSTSMGATAAKVGETLPADYKQQNTKCTNPAHNHISPDRVVDASTGLLPDTTFYFDGNRHDLTQHNDVILKLAMIMIASDEIRDVYSSPDFPQFLSGRNVQKLLPLIQTAKEIDRGKLSDEDTHMLNTALTRAQNTLDNNLATGAELKACETELCAVLVKIGAAEALPAEKDPTTLRNISLYLYSPEGCTCIGAEERMACSAGKNNNCSIIQKLSCLRNTKSLTHL